MRVVNKRTYTGTGHYVGRPSSLGNPYVIGTHGNRDRVVELYGRWLLNKIKTNDTAVINELKQLTKDSTLICWCAPLRCHGEMIERAWNWLCPEGTWPTHSVSRLYGDK